MATDDLLTFETPKSLVSPAGPDIFYEIVDDQLVESPPMGAYMARIASILGSRMEQFALAQGLGRAVTETLFRLRSGPSLQRRPDVAFVSFATWPKARRVPSTNAWDVVPELVVEVVSPSNFADEIPARLREYFTAGVRRAWIIYPHESLVYEYDSPRSVRVFGPEDTLDGGDVVPGFRLALVDLFEGTDEPRPA